MCEFPTSAYIWFHGRIYFKYITFFYFVIVYSHLIWYTDFLYPIPPIRYVTSIETFLNHLKPSWNVSHFILDSKKKKNCFTIAADQPFVCFQQSIITNSTRIKYRQGSEWIREVMFALCLDIDTKTYFILHTWFMIGYS